MLKLKTWVCNNRRFYGGHNRYSTYVWNHYHPDDIWKSGYCIHHKDGNTLNDTKNNLIKITSSEHRKLHTIGKNNPMYGVKLEGVLNGMYGKHHTKETKNKISISQTGKKHSEEHKLKISMKTKGIPKTEEHKLKISKSHVGMKHSKETIQKLKENWHHWHDV